MGMFFSPNRLPLDGAATSPDFKQMSIFAGGVLLLIFTVAFRDAWARETVRYTLQGMALIPIFSVAIRFPHHPLFRILNWKWVRLLGVYSYSMYLIHHLAIKFFEYHFAWASSPILKLLAVIPVAVLFAATMEYAVESRMRVLRRRFR